jgi:hypothetical protein
MEFRKDENAFLLWAADPNALKADDGALAQRQDHSQPTAVLDFGGMGVSDTLAAQDAVVRQ